MLVANAALPGTGRLEDFSSEELGRVLRVNLEAPIRLPASCCPRCRSGARATSCSSRRCRARRSARGRRCTRPPSSGSRVLAGAARGPVEGRRRRLARQPGACARPGCSHDSGAKPAGSAPPRPRRSPTRRAAIERDRHEVEVAPRSPACSPTSRFGVPSSRLGSRTGAAAGRRSPSASRAARPTSVSCDSSARHAGRSYWRHDDSFGSRSTL